MRMANDMAKIKMLKVFIQVVMQALFNDVEIHRAVLPPQLPCLSGGWH